MASFKSSHHHRFLGTVQEAVIHCSVDAVDVHSAFKRIRGYAVTGSAVAAWEKASDPRICMHVQMDDIMITADKK